MGSSASKSARTAGSAARKYPTRTPPSTTRPPVSTTPPAAAQQATQDGPSVHPPPQVSEVRNQAIDADARDPVLASRLTTLGAVQPNPHYSSSSTSSLDPQRNMSSIYPSDMMMSPPQSAFPDPRDNPALRVLEARSRIADDADTELSQVGRKGFDRRKYVDAGAVQLALMRRKRGDTDERIEEGLGIAKGRLAVLKRGVIEAV